MGLGISRSRLPGHGGGSPRDGLTKRELEYLAAVFSGRPDAPWHTEYVRPPTLGGGPPS